MPLQNRVDPYGTIFRTTARGTFMGNRGGAIHNEQKQIVRPYKSRQWISCVLEFKDRHRIVMTPRRYTELFFLDEAVSFAAGHRPCAECRRERFRAFQQAWGKHTRAPEMDRELHRARLDDRKNKVTYEVPLDSLPNGCFVHTDRGAWLVWDDALYLWSPEGYTSKEVREEGRLMTVLTPEPIVRCFRNGYIPEAHSSLGAL